jgi:hypothetical protein
VARENDGAGRSGPQLRFRDSSTTRLALKGKLVFSGARLSSDWEVSGGVFSLLRAQSPALFAPREYSEHAEPLRVAMSLSGASNVSFCGGQALRYGLSLKDRLSGLWGRSDSTYAISVLVVFSTLE